MVLFIYEMTPGCRVSGLRKAGFSGSSCVHTLEPKNPTFLMTAPAEKPSLNSCLV